MRSEADRRDWTGLQASVVEHYDRQLARFGPTARGMDWKDARSQELRFRVLSEVCDLGGRSVHEVGAGVGHFHDFLRERGLGADYSGSDLSCDMVAAARSLHPGVRFERLDILKEDGCPRYDVVVCSGLFHVKLDHSDEAWSDFVWTMVRRMFEMCRVAIAFNLMSDQVDFRAPTLFYTNPGAVMARCQRELSRFVTLRHDYPLYEYTVYAYRDAER